MGRVWEHTFEPGPAGEVRTIRFEYRPGGTVDIIAQDGNQLVELAGLPWAAMIAIWHVMRHFSELDLERIPKSMRE